jgi:transcriptional regulator with XRE-family HTH domain
VSADFGEKLRKRRIEKELTLETLAEKVGSTKAYIWQLENKSSAKPSGELLLKIANELDISAEYLIDDDSHVPNARHARIALARGADKRGLTQADVDRLFKISELMTDGKIDKGSQQNHNALENLRPKSNED